MDSNKKVAYVSDVTWLTFANSANLNSKMGNGVNFCNHSFVFRCFFRNKLLLFVMFDKLKEKKLSPLLKKNLY